MSIEDPRYLFEHQYQTDQNLNTRISLHARFSTNPVGWFRWLFEFIQDKAPDQAAILELGGGPGTFWHENQEHIPPDWSIHLSDRSAGMVGAARGRLGPAGLGFTFEQIDAQQIPLPGDTFDLVLANFMLHHVPDRRQAFGEIFRVLRPGGWLVAATIGKNHMRAAHQLAAAVLPEWPQSFGNAKLFSLENGAAQIAEYFPPPVLTRYPDSLEVTEAAPLLAYLLSSVSPAFIAAHQGSIQKLEKLLQRILDEQGRIHIPKDSGVFAVQKA
jgi:ubiquinone/menaquinone biosynthesis C-methylase UbiE